MKYWLMKTEPETYSWDDLVRDGGTHWDGVRNYAARNNMQAMEKGDLVLYYHSVKERNVVGVATVTKTAYQDPTTDDERWCVVDIKAVTALTEPVNLTAVKAQKTLQDMELVVNSRLSVQKVTKKAFEKILTMGQTTL